MNGPIFNEGLPIPITTKSLENVQSIFDKSYLVLANKTRMSPSERSSFYLKSNGVIKGSLSTDLGLVFTAAQVTLPIISNLGPTGVWEYTVQAFELLKLIFEAKKDGERIEINHTSDGSLVNVNTGTQNITFNGPVLAIASAALPNYEFFSKLLSDEKVTSISLGKSARPEIHLDVKDHKLFELPSEISEERHELNCEIFEFDKYEGAGSLSVFDEQSITKGEYRFDVIGQQNMNDYIEAMLRRHVKVVCLEEVVDHPVVGRKIISLKVVNVKPA
jgi:hypothetical protein